MGAFSVLRHRSRMYEEISEARYGVANFARLYRRTPVGMVGNRKQLRKTNTKGVGYLKDRVAAVNLPKKHLRSKRLFRLLSQGIYPNLQKV